MEKWKKKGLRIQDNAGIIVLEDGIALREWIERTAQEVSFKTIRCATFTVSAPGLQWIRRLTRDRQVQVLKPDPDLRQKDQKTTLRLAGTVPPEVWNRLGTRLLPKLRSGNDLSVGIELSVSVDSLFAQSLGTENRSSMISTSVIGYALR